MSSEERRRVHLRGDVLADARVALEARRVAHVPEGELVAGLALLPHGLVRQHHRAGIPEPVARHRDGLGLRPGQPQDAPGGNVFVDSPGVFTYSRRSAPFGFNGAYWYAGVSYDF